jgi:hypothetical protein
MQVSKLTVYLFTCISILFLAKAIRRRATIQDYDMVMPLITGSIFVGEAALEFRDPLALTIISSMVAFLAIASIPSKKHAFANLVCRIITVLGASTVIGIAASAIQDTLLEYISYPKLYGSVGLIVCSSISMIICLELNRHYSRFQSFTIASTLAIVINTITLFLLEGHRIVSFGYTGIATWLACLAIGFGTAVMIHTLPGMLIVSNNRIWVIMLGLLLCWICYTSIFLRVVQNDLSRYLVGLIFEGINILSLAGIWFLANNEYTITISSTGRR